VVWISEASPRSLEKAILPFCGRESSASAVFALSTKASKQIANKTVVVTKDTFRRLALLNATLYNTPPSSLRRPRTPHGCPERNFGIIHFRHRPCITQTMPLATRAFGLRPSSLLQSEQSSSRVPSESSPSQRAPAFLLPLPEVLCRPNRNLVKILISDYALRPSS
jgi:hypothetical protein